MGWRMGEMRGRSVRGDMEESLGRGMLWIDCRLWRLVFWDK